MATRQVKSSPRKSKERKKTESPGSPNRGSGNKQRTLSKKGRAVKCSVDNNADVAEFIPVAAEVIANHGKLPSPHTKKLRTAVEAPEDRRTPRKKVSVNDEVRKSKGRKVSVEEAMSRETLQGASPRGKKTKTSTESPSPAYKKRSVNTELPKKKHSVDTNGKGPKKLTTPKKRKMSENNDLVSNEKGKMAFAAPQQRHLLEEETEIIGEVNGNKYKVKCKLGAGGFGDVYKVMKFHNRTACFAMKTEHAEVKVPKLDLEWRVLEEVEKHFSPNKERLAYFTRIYDKGCAYNLNFIVMDLVGLSIDDLRRKRGANFSEETAVRLAVKMLDPIGQLHEIGYLHRDLKPGNFCIGLDSNADDLFILDFGIACRYRRERPHHGTHVEDDPNKRVPFAGTLPFCSRRSLEHKVLSRRDDMESWLYVFYDLRDRHSLPWKRCREPATVLTSKQAFFGGKHEDLIASDSHFQAFDEYEQLKKVINDIKFAADPDYEDIKNQVKKLASRRKIDHARPYDWWSRVETTESKDEDSKKEQKKKSENEEARKPKEEKIRAKEKATKERTVEVTIQRTAEKEKDKESKEGEAAEKSKSRMKELPSKGSDADNKKISSSDQDERKKTASSEVEKDEKKRSGDEKEKEKEKKKSASTAKIRSDLEVAQVKKKSSDTKEKEKKKSRSYEVSNDKKSSDDEKKKTRSSDDEKDKKKTTTRSNEVRHREEMEL